ncbi:MULTISPECIES: histidinol-phosphatase [Saccharibacillus]|uniref:Histidinol-phosphatase n=1 Tax=Saccharibacillus brassicae TaxID=2583377 RepID=A0A4Y6UW62_SACBS|nr:MULTISPECIES: histidinol-phosphatase [Saccharibacillus]MWJ32505.1 histidinol-phosphatase HisJ family protein [Saccharibacillus sp. WB 17]QDH20507.1 histidinol-phosphatase [Saccharibacillus brassicae]
MKFDLHTHHYRCGHADGDIRDYIEAAIGQGLSVIGISDHMPHLFSPLDHPIPTVAMSRLELDSYVQEVLRLKKEYEGRIDVLLGIESDYFTEHEQVYRDAIERYPFDYVIGSVHISGGKSIFDRNRWTDVPAELAIEAKRDYYRLIEASARSGMFQILGHIDAMKGYYPAFSDIPAEAAVESALRTIGEHGLAIEVNTSGGTKHCGGWYPSDAILERALHYGVSISFGSDAHKPSRVGEDFEAVAAKLREIGFKEWIYVKQRRPVSVPL